MFSVSYNDDCCYNSYYYIVDYYQMVYSGVFGLFGLWVGIQCYNNGDSSVNIGKYIVFDLLLLLGNWFSVGMIYQNGYIMVNFLVCKQFDEGIICIIGVNLL